MYLDACTLMHAMPACVILFVFLCILLGTCPLILLCVPQLRTTNLNKQQQCHISEPGVYSRSSFLQHAVLHAVIASSVSLTPTGAHAQTLGAQYRCVRNH
jgi:hypothetical protein